MSEEVTLLAEHTGRAGCACASCAGNSDPYLDVRLDTSADPDAGTIHANGKPIWTVEQISAYLNRSGAGWNDEPWQANQSDANLDVINFGFHLNQTTLFNNGYVVTTPTGGLAGLPEFFNFAPFSEAQKAAARLAIGFWDELIDVSFAETHVNSADIAFSNLASAPNTQAYAILPLSVLYGVSWIDAQVGDIAGDVWVSLSQASNMQLGFGEYGFKSIVHEIGHALGLSHPGNYNAAPGVLITYPVNAEYYQDSRQYTTMSYFNAEFTGSGHVDWGKLTWIQAATPLVHDIAAIQKIYGADPTTRTGDNVYGFNSNSGNVYDFTVNKLPVLCIYDAGGEDTLDFSGWNSASIIDLNPGAFSSGGGSGVVPLDQLKAAGLLPASFTEADYLAMRTAYKAVDGMLDDNISIAYGTTIENAVGGGGNDLIAGNAVANVLRGNGGDDGLAGRDGDDLLDGGVGADTMMGGKGNDHFMVENGGDLVAELIGEGNDTVESHIDYVLTDHVENLLLVGSARTGTGNAIDNLLVGNALANRLDGGAGNDRLVGGNGFDFSKGGQGADVFVASIDASKFSTKNGTMSVDAVLDFTKGEDKIDLSGIDAKAGGGWDTFTFLGTDNGKNAGQLFYKGYDSVNGAERALGIDLDGVDGASPYEGKVSVVFGNVDGGTPDFMLVLFNTDGVSASDFIFVDDEAFGAAEASSSLYYASSAADHIGAVPLLF